MKAAVLTDRAVLRVSGLEAPHFLNNLVTSATEKLAFGGACHAALLTPQGKIIADFIVVAVEDGYLLDVPSARVAELKKRLTLYKLRAKVTIAAEEHLSVAAFWDSEGAPPFGLAVIDPRLPDLGWRAFLTQEERREGGFGVASEDDYHAHRIALGVPEGGRDFAFDDAFPHEADMDQLGGVDFRKGCYIGQEVVSRMQHRGTARTRVVPVRLSGSASPGDEIQAGERRLGHLGSVAGEHALAMLRLDRVEDALAAGEPMMAGSAVITLSRPDWARFRFPGDPLPEAAQ